MEEGLPETLRLRYWWNCVSFASLPGSDQESLDKGFGASRGRAVAEVAVDGVPQSGTA